MNEDKRPQNIGYPVFFLILSLDISENSLEGELL